MQYYKPENRKIVLTALKKAGRTDLIGFDKKCLIRPRQDKRFGAQGTFKKEEPKKAAPKKKKSIRNVHKKKAK